MQGALARAGLAPGDIDYINLHGTATPANDLAEGLAVSGVFGTALGAGVPCSSTKGITGHTLGAAGALEAVVCALALEHGLLPPSVFICSASCSNAPLPNTILPAPVKENIVFMSNPSMVCVVRNNASDRPTMPADQMSPYTMLFFCFLLQIMIGRSR